MNRFILVLCLLASTITYGQSDRPENYGFRHFQTVFKGDTVDILVKSGKGEEQVKKPLFLFCQGSLPIPLIIRYDENGNKGNPTYLFGRKSLRAYLNDGCAGQGTRG